MHDRHRDVARLTTDAHHRVAQGETATENDGEAEKALVSDGGFFGPRSVLAMPHEGDHAASREHGMGEGCSVRVDQLPRLKQDVSGHAVPENRRASGESFRKIRLVITINLGEMRSPPAQSRKAGQKPRHPLILSPNLHSANLFRKLRKKRIGVIFLSNIDMHKTDQKNVH